MHGSLLPKAILIAALSAGAGLAEEWPQHSLNFVPLPEARPPEVPCYWHGRVCGPRGHRWVLWPPPQRTAAPPPPPTLDDALALLEAGQNTEARDRLDSLARRVPQDPMVWALRARAERRLGQLDAATESLRRALALDPGLPAALAEQGFLWLSRGQPDPALAALATLEQACGACAEAIRLRSALTGAGYHAGGTGPKWIRLP